jgi:hypothetical protein
MQKDIRHYDMRYFRIYFKLTKHSQTVINLICKFTVKGSSENRPMIRSGDIVCFRPVEEDLGENSLTLFELRGVVTNFSLKDELVTCVFCVPLNSSITTPFSDILPFSHSNVKKILNRPRYHIRFTSDVCGVSFIQKALAAIAVSIPLQLATFPPKDYSLGTPLPRLLKHSVKLPMDADLNLEQREAVEMVSALYLRGQEDCRLDDFMPAPPYIIFGPPGTGKTKTLISVIRGLLAVASEEKQGEGEGEEEGEGGTRVLACAPSDAGRVVGIDSKKLLIKF